MTYRYLLVCLFLLGFWSGGAWAQTHPVGPQRFTVVAFHDVQDRASDLDPDAVTTDRLVAFFDHVRGDGWNPVSLQDLSDARQGVKPLPPKPILITFDDGYRSLYTRVFPLLMAYRIPVVAALVGEWMASPLGSEVPYGGSTKPRDYFLDWSQAREMQASGWVEFASHTYNQHRELLSNPQGNLTPALLTLSFDPASGSYETPAQYRQRLLDDLRSNEALMVRELGKKPRAVVWPYGRYNQTAIEVLAQAGYEFALTLSDELGDVQRPLAIGRYWPTGNLRVTDLVNDLRFLEVLPRARRMVRIDPGQWWTGDAQVFDQRLGEAIEQLRSQAITDVVIEGLHHDTDSGHWRAWFPTRALPLREDLLSRIVWQLKTRANVRATVDLSFSAMTKHLQEDELLQLHHDLGWQVPTDGLWMDLMASPSTEAERSKDLSTRWASVQGPARRSVLSGDLRAARRQLTAQDLHPSERSALSAFRKVENSRPELHWWVHTDWRDPAPLATWADLVLMEITPSIDDPQASTRSQLQVAGVDDPLTRRRTGMWINAPQPLSEAQRAKLVLELQAAGLAVMGGAWLSK